jgi:hypothetical protein
MDFDPLDVLALLACDKDIIGGPCPRKTIAWENVYDAATLGVVPPDNPNALAQFGGDYVFTVAPTTTHYTTTEPIPVLDLGAAFMMVKREVFLAFQAAYPQQQFTPDSPRLAEVDGTRPLCAFFDTAIDPTTKRYLSEDYMFCHWARAIGREVWLCPWMDITHTGAYVFGGWGAREALASLSEARQRSGHATPVVPVGAS